MSSVVPLRAVAPFTVLLDIEPGHLRNEWVSAVATEINGASLSGRGWRNEPGLQSTSQSLSNPGGTQAREEPGTDVHASDTKRCRFRRVQSGDGQCQLALAK